uniref:Uncharacterized protein n=1 Tax=Triticum urartu TaxID=4572 RepID=A0A8R7P6W2_TRIUA
MCTPAVQPHEYHCLQIFPRSNFCSPNCY